MLVLFSVLSLEKETVVSNEEMVLKIQQGQDVNNNMLLLYNANLPLIRKVCAPFAQHDSMEDLLQSAFLSLYDAVKGYRFDVGTKFTTYALIIIRQGLIRYVDECCQIVRIPAYRQAQVIKYKQFCTDFEKCNGRKPTDEELCQYLDIDIKELKQIRTCSFAPESLDKGWQDEEDSYTLADTIADNADIAEDTCDKVVNEQLWEVIEEALPEEHALILKARYIENLTYKQTAELMGVSPERCRQMEHECLRKLNYGKARAKLQQKLDYEYGSRLYKNGKHGFDIHFSSQVERLALRSLEIRDEFYGVKDSIYR